MKTLSTVLSCLGLICAVLPAMAQTRLGEAAAVRVPAGPLDDAVEALAKQAGVNVIYPGDLLEGRTTSGVNATISPREAFRKLLDGTSLVFTEERGALRISKAASTAPIAGSSISTVATTPMNAATSGVWGRHELRAPCADCDWTHEVSQILQHLGAAGIQAGPQIAEFLSLSPGVGGDRTADAKSEAMTYWRTVIFSSGGHRSQDSALGIRPDLYDNLRTRILPLFTTRHVSENDGLLAVDVLVAGPPPVASECHRVLKDNTIQRYCGRADQWAGLRAREGFRCRKDVRWMTGSRAGTRTDELCGAASDWKRLELTRSTQAAINNGWPSGEAASSAAQQHPMNTFGPTTGAPVTPSPVAPAPAPAR